MIHLFLVEDNSGDVELFMEALQDAGQPCRLSVNRDGAAALASLQATRDREPADLPNVIVLDLNLPKLSGHEVLSALKQDEALRSIPVIILTSSRAETDIARGYAAHADDYCSKPSDMPGYVRLVRRLLALDLKIDGFEPTATGIQGPDPGRFR